MNARPRKLIVSPRASYHEYITGWNKMLLMPFRGSHDWEGCIPRNYGRRRTDMNRYLSQWDGKMLTVLRLFQKNRDFRTAWNFFIWPRRLAEPRHRDVPKDIRGSKWIISEKREVEEPRPGRSMKFAPSKCSLIRRRCRALDQIFPWRASLTKRLSISRRFFQKWKWTLKITIAVKRKGSKSASWTLVDNYITLYRPLFVSYVKQKHWYLFLFFAWRDGISANWHFTI